MKLKDSFYRRQDLLAISQELLGKFLFTNIDGGLTGGQIIETEAYRGPDDRASHAYGNRRTKRTEVMFHAGGICYVYLCYGIHALLNVVVGAEGDPHAVLIRAIKPTDGIALMQQRRAKCKEQDLLTAGPGTLTQALGITLQHNGLSLQSDLIWIEDRHARIDPSEIMVGPRVNVSYAADDAWLPWRFRIAL
jgi:DNA-3-methyladenine glycosylase